MSEDAIDRILVLENWKHEFRLKLNEYTIAANLLNGIVRDGIILFGKDKTEILCETIKKKYVEELKAMNESRGTNGVV